MVPVWFMAETKHVHFSRVLILHMFSTFTTDGTTLNTFAHHSSEPQDQVKYHQYPTSNSFLISSYKDFKKSRRRLRNLRDDAKETSQKLRDELNEKWYASQQYIYKGDEGDEHNYDDQEDKDDGPNSQLSTKYHTNFTKDADEDVDDDKSFVQIPTPDASSPTSSKRPLARPSTARPATKLRRLSKSNGVSKSSRSYPDRVE